MMAARVEAAELAKRMRFAMSPGGLLIHGEVMRLFYAALPYVERAAAQPPAAAPSAPGEPNCPKCEDPEAPTLHRHPPASEVLGEHGRMMALPDEVPAGQAATPVGEDIYRCTFGHLHRGKGWAVSCLGDA